MSLAAILRALAQGFENAAVAAESENTEPTTSATRGRKAKTVTAPDPSPAAATAAPAATAPAAQQLAPQPAAPSITRDQLNKAVLAVASMSRDEAVAVLAKFGAANTATIPVEKYQAVFDAMEEKKAELDAAKAKEPASLV